MIVETLRAITDWLNDPTNGLVAMLATIPYDAGDAAPSVGTIADETRNTLVAQERFPSSPGVMVSMKKLDHMDGEVATITRDSTVDVLIRIGRSNLATEVAAAETSYILRAAIKSLRLFNGDSRVRNQIQFYSCNKLTSGTLWSTIDDTVVTGAIAGQWQLRDTSP